MRPVPALRPPAVCWGESGLQWGDADVQEAEDQALSLVGSGDSVPEAVTFTLIPMG